MHRSLLPYLALVTPVLLHCSAGGSLGGRGTAGCIDDRDCPSGETCAFDGTQLACLPEGGASGVVDCEGPEDCPSDFACEQRGTRRICVPLELRPGDLCDPACGAGEECRDGLCITADESGDNCEFDPECGDGFLCIAGRCTQDPRVAVSCADGEMCPEGLTCSEGRCVCTANADCPIGLRCEAGMCVPNGCVADDECPADALCDRGMCRPRTECDVTHPDLSGSDWDLDTTLSFREALPDWLAGFLGVVDGPFQFLGGRTEDPALGLPLGLNRVAGNAIRNWAEANVPRYVLDLLGALGDLSDILETWIVLESMELRATGPDSYTGTHTWERACFEYRRRDVCGTPEEILDYRVTPAEFTAQSVCGTFNINEHRVNVSIGQIVNWLVNTIVRETTGFETLEIALGTASAGFCTQVGIVAEDAIRGVNETAAIGVSVAAETWCLNELGRRVMELSDAVERARISADFVRLKGFAPIESRASLQPGVWEGSLIGGDFPGTFTATR